MIYVTGDSWTQRSNTAEDYSWPLRLEQLLNHPVINEATGCGSNSRMLSKIQNLHFQNTKPDLIIIALTGFSRYHVPGPSMSSWSIGPTVINDRFSRSNDVILRWWLENVYDEVEFVFQTFKTIWQIHEFCKTYLQCPVLFQNAWSDENTQIANELLVQNNIKKWVHQRVQDIHDYSTDQYIQAFEFFQTASTEWLIDYAAWPDIFDIVIDGPKGLHPGHPNPDSHRLIANHVCSIIEQKLPNLYHTLKGNI
jgi:hypothetical protein